MLRKMRCNLHVGVCPLCVCVCVWGGGGVATTIYGMSIYVGFIVAMLLLVSQSSFRWRCTSKHLLGSPVVVGDMKFLSQ